MKSISLNTFFMVLLIHFSRKCYLYNQFNFSALFLCLAILYFSSTIKSYLKYKIKHAH